MHKKKKAWEKTKKKKKNPQRCRKTIPHCRKQRRVGVNWFVHAFLPSVSACLPDGTRVVRCRSQAERKEIDARTCELCDTCESSGAFAFPVSQANFSFLFPPLATGGSWAAYMWRREMRWCACLCLRRCGACANVLVIGDLLFFFVCSPPGARGGHLEGWS